MIKKGNEAFAIILAMILVSIMLLVAYNLLAMIIPFSQNTKSIENATNAYYQAYGGVEESINFIAKSPVGSETGQTMPTSSTGYSYSVSAVGTSIPNPGKGNSEFDKNWNKIAPGFPVHLYFQGGNTIDWNNTKIYFRVPNIDGDYGTPETLTGGISPIINWQISGSGFTLNSSGITNMIGTGNINNSTSSGINFTLGGQNGIDLDGTGSNFSNFYINKLGNCSSLQCSLNFSIVNQLISSTNEQIPYLEYKIDFKNSGGSAINVPEQYVDIKTEGKSYGFKKYINTKYRINTTSEAFYFTVFQ
ncbi:MAG: hypothetical protein PHR68_00745 [Candidatus Gracilibacteria bacterium]|nr:hypothetical protein [Candidatus Gracilibacteria bacterium]